MNLASETVGDRLRRIRHQQRLSLADVEARSGGAWKAVVVGAYERGDRSISIARLAALAGFYRVPVGDLLHEPARGRAAAAPAGVTLDLRRLDTGEASLEALVRFVIRVRRIRGDHDGRVLSLRGSDLDTIAMTVGSDADQLRTALADRGALLRP
jgi:transcriptional regulator with XRE-family HTH domain